MQTRQTTLKASQGKLGHQRSTVPRENVWNTSKKTTPLKLNCTPGFLLLPPCAIILHWEHPPRSQFSWQKCNVSKLQIWKCERRFPVYCFQYFAQCWSVFSPGQSHIITRTCFATAPSPVLFQLWRQTFHTLLCTAYPQYWYRTLILLHQKFNLWWTHNYGADISLRLLSLFLHK